MALYRGVAEPAASALKKFAPEMSLSLDQASVEVGADFVLRDLRARARTDGKGVELDVAAASSRWKRATLQARVEYADLSASGTVALEELSADPDLAPATLRARLRTDGSTALECEFDGRLGTLLPAAKGRLLLPAGKPPQLAAELTGVDVAQGIALARRKGAAARRRAIGRGQDLREGHGDARPAVAPEPGDRQVGCRGQLAQLPWKLSLHAAKVALSRERVLVTEAKGALGSSSFENAATQIDFGGKPVVSSASGRATLQVEQWLPWLKGKLPLDQIVSASGRVDVVLHRLTLPLDRPAALDFDAVATARKLRATLQGLPDPVNVAAGTVRARTQAGSGRESAGLGRQLHVCGGQCADRARQGGARVVGFRARDARARAMVSVAAAQAAAREDRAGLGRRRGDPEPSRAALRRSASGRLRRRRRAAQGEHRREDAARGGQRRWRLGACRCGTGHSRQSRGADAGRERRRIRKNRFEDSSCRARACRGHRG